MTTLSTFKSKSGPLTLNTQLALSSSAGCKRSPVIGKLTEILDSSIAVSVLNEETGLEMPTFVELKDAKFVTHTAGFELTGSAREGVKNMFEAAMDCYEGESVLTARRIIVKLLEQVQVRGKRQEGGELSHEEERAIHMHQILTLRSLCCRRRGTSRRTLVAILTSLWILLSL